MCANHSHSCRSSASAAGHQRPPLRKQHTCAADGMTTTKCYSSASIGAPTMRISAGAAGRAPGGGLRKQMSVDQVVLLSGQRHTAASASSSSARVATTAKPRGSDYDIPAQSAVSHHSTDRINLNIFLSPGSQQQSSLDAVDPISDNNSDSVTAIKTPLDAAADVRPAPTPATAADRRAAFQASKTLGASIERSRTLVASVAQLQQQPLTTPPPPPTLVRAMSAPIRCHDDKQTAAKRRLSRRRRPPVQRDRSMDSAVTAAAACDQPHGGRRALFMDQLREDADDVIGGGGGTAAATVGRSRSVLSGRSDVITLVSLLMSSSGGSDSERDEEAGDEDKTDDADIPGRAPALRKTGKSETGAADEVAGGLRVEFPMILRRGSIVPLAARIRANRPPTAPAGSIYMRHEFHERSATAKPADETSTDMGVSHLDVDSSVAASEVTTPTASATKQATSPTTMPIDYPQFCRSAKERECWVLFQKMLHKGVTVSYETILRGLLTPTELRAVMKQRDADAMDQQELADGESSAKTVVKCS